MTDLKELLPLGSVAAIKIRKEPFLAMIAGYLPQTGAQRTTWDYLGIPYPAGISGKNKVFVFDGDSIVSVIVRGCEDPEAQEHRKIIQKIRALLPERKG